MTMRTFPCGVEGCAGEVVTREIVIQAAIAEPNSPDEPGGVHTLQLQCTHGHSLIYEVGR